MVATEFGAPALKDSPTSATARVQFRIRFENGNVLIFHEFLLVIPMEKERRHTSVRAQIDTVWIGCGYGVAWFRVRLRHPLR